MSSFACMRNLSHRHLICDEGKQTARHFEGVAKYGYPQLTGHQFSVSKVTINVRALRNIAKKRHVWAPR